MRPSECHGKYYDEGAQHIIIAIVLNETKETMCYRSAEHLWIYI